VHIERRKILLAVLIAAAQLVMSAQLVHAEGGQKKANPHLLKTKTTSVSVFKNGLGFFMREGTAIKRDGWVMAEEIPPAKFGTLAIFSHDETEHVDIVGAGPGEVFEFDGVDRPDSLEARQQSLKAAKELKVELVYRENGSDRTGTGTLVSTDEKFSILDTGEQSIAVPVASVSRMQIIQMPLRIHLKENSENADDTKSNSETKLGVAYLSGGITWVPEYSVKVLDDETAELTLRGTLVNEAEDLIHCDVNFVVGVPHFAHSSYMAPLAVGQVIRTVGTAVAPRQLRTQIMNRAAIVSNGDVADQFRRQVADESSTQPAVRGELSTTTKNLPRIDSAGGSDYTVYTKQDMTLRRGEKAIVTLFTQKIRYTNVYRWSPPEPMRHFLQLHNDTESAWTTGPYLAISGGRPLSEDILRYTPKNGRAEIAVSSAINVANSKRENESDRELKAHQPDKYKFWDLVTLSGELKFKNCWRDQLDVQAEAKRNQNVVLLL